MAFDDPFNVNDSNENFYNNFNEGDPAAEFLEREKRELGDITGSSSNNAFHSQSNGSISNSNEKKMLFVESFFLLFQLLNQVEVFHRTRQWVIKRYLNSTNK